MQRPAVPSWRRIATPIALAIVSLAIAIGLWVAVTNAQNPNTVAVFGGGIEVTAVNIPDGMAVASVRDPTVTLRVSTDQDTFSKLTTADFRAEVDLSGVHESTSDQVVVAHVVSRKNVEVTQVSPSLVSVTVEQAATKQVPVQANLIGSPPQGFSAGNPEATPATVRVTGAASLVQLVASAAADVNLTGLRTSLQQQYSLTARDARGADIRGVSLTPNVAGFHINVAQQEITRALTIVPAIQGSVADGYNLIAVSSDPPALAVTGPLELAQALPYMTTDPIDVSGLHADLTRTVRLKVPVGLQASRDSVNVLLKVVPAQGDIVLSVAPQVTNLGDGLHATLQTSSLTVKLHGDLPVLRALAPGAVKAQVSADAMDVGVHIITPNISVPEGIQLVSADPLQVVVVISK